MEKEFKLCRNLSCRKVKSKDEFYPKRAICKECFKNNLNKKTNHTDNKNNINEKINMLILKIDTLDNKINEVQKEIIFPKMDIQKCILLFLITFFIFKIDIKILSFIILLYIYLINKEFLKNIISEINFNTFFKQISKM